MADRDTLDNSDSRVKCVICGKTNQEGESVRSFMKKHHQENPKHVEFDRVKK